MYVGYTNFGAISIISYILGIEFSITTITGFCLIYKFLGISTKKTSVQTPTQQQEKPSQPAQFNQPTNQPNIEQLLPTNTQTNSPSSTPQNEQPKSPGWPTN